MSHHLMDSFKIASIGESISGKEIVSLNLTVKTNIGLERGGQMNLHM